ncbi:MAG TPA: hypothetical protein PKE55_13880, partial [Kiritimatiellia bacterium]|nr:hypothetical protein [Kiritimatiellia bacterium]
EERGDLSVRVGVRVWVREGEGIDSCAAGEKMIHRRVHGDWRVRVRRELALVDSNFFDGLGRIAAFGDGEW